MSGGCFVRRRLCPPSLQQATHRNWAAAASRHGSFLQQRREAEVLACPGARGEGGVHRRGSVLARLRRRVAQTRLRRDHFRKPSASWWIEYVWRGGIQAAAF